MAGDQGLGYAPHFITEREVILSGAEVIGVRQRDVEYAHQEGDPEDRPCGLERNG
jgi:hypothetical protein